MHVRAKRWNLMSLIHVEIRYMVAYNICSTTIKQSFPSLRGYSYGSTKGTLKTCAFQQKTLHSRNQEHDVNLWARNKRTVFLSQNRIKRRKNIIIFNTNYKIKIQQVTRSIHRYLENFQKMRTNQHSSIPVTWRHFTEEPIDEITNY